MSSAEIKERGKSTNGAAKDFVLASGLAESQIEIERTIDDFVGTWTVKLQAGALGLWDEGRVFEVTRQTDRFGEITFQLSGDKLPAQFDVELQVLKYENGPEVNG
ncbi:MAG: hypothetical protein V3T83_12545 [Acidobacteriota bacterium]